jgi:autotransporter-associated beta strand protein
MGDFLTYDAGGLQRATYSGTNTAVAVAGEIINQTSSSVVSGTRSLYGVRFASSVGSATIGVSGGTLKLGVLADSPTEVRAPQAGLIMTSPTTINTVTFSISSDVDLGSSELAAFVVNKAANSTGRLSGNVSGTGGLTKHGAGRLELTGTANAISGPVAIWEGSLQVNGGNGLDDAATVSIGTFGTLDLVNATGNSDSVASLSGIGTVKIAAGKTLAVTGTLTAGDTENSLSITTGGTLFLPGSATLSVDLDYANSPTGTPRLVMSSTALQLGAGAKLKLNSLLNRPTGTFNRSFVLASYASRTGSFATQVDVPGGLVAQVVHDDVNKVIRLDVTAGSRGTVIAIK